MDIASLLSFLAIVDSGTPITHLETLRTICTKCTLTANENGVKLLAGRLLFHKTLCRRERSSSLVFIFGGKGMEQKYQYHLRDRRC